MRLQHLWEFDSDDSNHSSSGQGCDSDDSTEDDELSHMLYQNAASNYEQSKSPNQFLHGSNQLTLVLQDAVENFISAVSKIVPFLLVSYSIYLFYCYLAKPHLLSELPSNLGALSFLFSTNFKCCLCVGILILLFARIAYAIAKQAAVTRALMEARFQSAGWQLKLKVIGVESMNTLLLPQKMFYMICAKWAYASLRIKCSLVMLVTLVLFIYISGLNVLDEAQVKHKNILLDANQLQKMFATITLALLLSLLSTDILAVQWGCIGATFFLHIMLNTLCTWLLISVIHFHHQVPSLLVLREVFDYRRHLGTDNLKWLYNNRGVSPDIISYIITILIDGIVIGALHEANGVSLAIRILNACGPSFLGLTGVEALAVLGTEFLPLPSVVMLLFPYLCKMSESEAAFFFTLVFNCSVTSTDRSFSYFGIMRDNLLLWLILVKQMCILGSIVICKILFPIRVQHYVSCAGFQYPNKTSATRSLIRRIISGSLAGLKLAKLISKVVLVSRFSSILFLKFVNAVLSYVSALAAKQFNVQGIIQFISTPMLFPISISMDTLKDTSQLLGEIFTAPIPNQQAKLLKFIQFDFSHLYLNRNRSKLEISINDDRVDLLAARHLYYKNNNTTKLQPVLLLYLMEDGVNLIEHLIFIAIIIFHCLSGSRISHSLVWKVLFAVLVNWIFNLHMAVE